MSSICWYLYLRNKWPLGSPVHLNLALAGKTVVSVCIELQSHAPKHSRQSKAPEFWKLHVWIAFAQAGDGIVAWEDKTTSRDGQTDPLSLWSECMLGTLNELWMNCEWSTVHSGTISTHTARYFKAVKGVSNIKFLSFLFSKVSHILSSCLCLHYSLFTFTEKLEAKNKVGMALSHPVVSFVLCWYKWMCGAFGSGLRATQVQVVERCWGSGGKMRSGGLQPHNFRTSSAVARETVVFVCVCGRGCVYGCVCLWGRERKRERDSKITLQYFSGS